MSTVAAGPIRVVAGVLAKPKLRPSEPAQYLIGPRKHKILDGRWEFPGGKVEPGESDATAVEREWMEELGIEVRAGFKYGELLQTHALEPGLLIELIVLRLFPVETPIEVNLLEAHYRMEWFTKAQILRIHPKFGTPSLHPIAEMLENTPEE